MNSFEHLVPPEPGPPGDSTFLAGQPAGAGVTLAGLEVVGELGQGADTVVYRVRREGTDYALKILRDPASDLARTLRFFRREAAVLASVGHPGLPRIYQAGEDAGRPYLVMDLVDGRPLGDQLGDGPLPAARVISMAVDIVDELAAVHAAGLIHRDIKPQNVMVLATGTARLIDFGFATLSKARDDILANPDEVSANHADTMVGTLTYAAPEQSGVLTRPVDQRSDLYSLGVVLFQCLTGDLPFTAASLGELLRMHLTMPAPKVDEVAAGVGPGLAAVIGTLLAKDPDDRYQSCENLLADLRRLAVDPDADLQPIRTGAERTRTRLAGRVTEFNAVVDRWTQATRGRGGVCLVRGSSGVGKSRFLRELIALAAGQGALVLVGKCAPDDAVPLAAIRTAIDNHVHSAAMLPEPARTEQYRRLRLAAGSAAPLLGALSAPLRTLLAAPELADEDRSGQFETAVAGLLCGLAQQHGTLLLVVEDIQWLDAGSLRLLAQLAEDAADVPLLLVATARSDDDSRAATERFSDTLRERIDLHLEMLPLDDQAMAVLIADRLPGIGTSPLASLLITRARGNPFVVIEYLHAVLDAGLLSPSWGGWLVDEEGLDALELPRDAIGLVLARVQDMGSASRQLLTIAAATGVRFSLGLVAEVGGFSQARAAQLIRDAEERGLVEGLGADRYAFLHDRIREALLADLDPVATARLNQDIAETLDAGDSQNGPSETYAVARHYMLGVGAPAVRIVEVCFAAARLALEEHAPARAVGFLAHAESFGEFIDGASNRLYGIALARDGQHAQAKARFTRALDHEPDRLRRAELLAMLANVFRANWDTTGALMSVRDGLAETGSRWPRNRVSLVLSTIWLALAGLLVAITRIGAGSAAGRDRARFSLVCDLHEVGAYSCIIGLHPGGMVLHSLRGLYAAARLGPSPQYVRVVGSLGLTAGALGLSRFARRLFVLARRVAAPIGDPRLTADMASQSGAAEFLGASDDGEAWEALLVEQGRWLDAGRYSDGVAAICWELACAGRTAEALGWYQRGKAKVRRERDTTALVTFGALAHTMVGEFAEAAVELRRVYALLAGNGGRGLGANAVLTDLHALVEQEDFGPQFDLLLTRFRDFVTEPMLMIRPHRMVVAFAAIGRVAQYRSAVQSAVVEHDAPGRTSRTAGFARRDSDSAALAQTRARTAVRQLRRFAGTPFLRALAQVTAADLLLIEGDSAAALRLLDRVGPVRRDAPVIAFDAARVRARCHAVLGAAAEARRQAQYAKSVAIEQQWPHRERWINEEFKLVDVHGGLQNHASAVIATSARSEAYRERLRALEEISRASARVLDPDALARVALDKIISILGADRAVLFLVGPDVPDASDPATAAGQAGHVRDGPGSLVAHLGRNDSGEDIQTLTAYSSTVVERVRATGEPTVLAGTDQGEAAMNSSVVLHGLRSIMAAPMELDGRLMGVVYLDSKVAKGIFTSDDLGLLRAVANYVATAFATARAAQLELSVQIAGQQRDVAESLRRALSQMSAEHDPLRVLIVLLEVAAQMLPCDDAWLMVRDAETPETVTIIGMGAEHRSWTAPVDAVIDGLLAAPTPVVGDLSRTLPAALPVAPAAAWLAIPVPGRSGCPGALVLVSPRAGAYQEAQVELGSTLAIQGATAFDNANLFSQLQRLATVDDLTGIANRRTFFDQATAELRAAVQRGGVICAAMIDIDYFKKVNDTYGHLAGDEVIRTVVARLAATIRAADLIGRYGGEEFALIMPDTGLTSAAPISERLRMAVEREPVQTKAGMLRVTVSVGIAELHPGDDIITLLARADAALYRAKSEGRNLVRTG